MLVKSVLRAAAGRGTHLQEHESLPLISARSEGEEIGYVLFRGQHGGRTATRVVARMGRDEEAKTYLRAQVHERIPEVCGFVEPRLLSSTLCGIL